MIQVIFIEEVEKQIRQETPGKNATLTTLAVIAGYDTRKIMRIKSNASYLKQFHKEERFLSSITPECSVLDVWESNPEYRESITGKPKVLKIYGPAPSFESLIGTSVPTRGVTVTSFLQRLESSGSILVDKKLNKVQMLDKRYTPFQSKDKTESVKIGMAVVGNLLDTITHNLNAPPKNEEPFYQRGCWTNRLKKTDSRKLRDLIKAFLVEVDEEARKIMMPFEQVELDANQITAGVSMFYFEEQPEH